MQKNQNQKNCDGCQTTEVIEERRRGDTRVNDERWDTFVRISKVAAWFVGITLTVATIIFAAVSLSVGLSLRTVSGKLDNMDSTLSSLTENISGLASTSSDTKRGLDDEIKKHDSDVLWLSGRIEENKKTSELNGAWIKGLTRKCEERFGK